MDNTINEPSPPTFAPSNLLALTVDSLGSRHGTMKDEDAAAAISGESKSMSLSTEWTDEKHSLYLDSMEASFVQQLYTNNFIGLSTLEKKEQSKASSSSSSYKPFGRQFKVLRDGQWGRIDFERNNNGKRQTEVEEDGAALLLMNPWIRHFRSGRSQTAADNSRKEGILAEGSSSSSSCIAAESRTEMTDQNFGDEDDGNIQAEEVHEEEMVKAKRIRTWAIASRRKKDKVKLKNKML
ncbi:cold-regulated protein 27-like isoform X2 [Impatiens glandulifera]|uniref:cold-regulated protein 27-like isoform X2 n=1 Tax=Impatiens glandulifera TaxID=253017 RepID=UPI001FB0CBDA|nr:cold-regulated protein 27-like isoform X2 [Impatiens glandulifera]